MAFFTIFVAPGLSEADNRRALSFGPSFVSSRRRDHREMLVAAGFSKVEALDLTHEFRETQQAWLDGRERYARELVAADGQAAFNERQAEGRRQLAGIEAGLLRRALFVCS